MVRKSAASFGAVLLLASGWAAAQNDPVIYMATKAGGSQSTSGVIDVFSGLFDGANFSGESFFNTGDDVVGKVVILGKALNFSFTHSRTDNPSSNYRMTDPLDAGYKNTTLFKYWFDDKNGNRVERSFLVKDVNGFAGAGQQASPSMSSYGWDTNPNWWNSYTRQYETDSSQHPTRFDLVGQRLESSFDSQGRSDQERFFDSARTQASIALTSQFVVNQIGQSLSAAFNPVEEMSGDPTKADFSALNVITPSFGYRAYQIRISGMGACDGEVYSVPLTYTRRLNDRVSFRFTIPLAKDRLAGNDTWRIGAKFAVPVRVLGLAPTDDMRLTLTPEVGQVFEGSKDWFHAGFVLNASITGRFDKRIGDKWLFTWGTMLGYWKSIDVNSFSSNMEDFLWNYGINQAAVINRARGGYFLYKDLLLDVYAADTRFLIRRDGERTYYNTLGAGASWRAWQGRCVFRLGASGDIGDQKYHSYGGDFSASVKF